MTNPMLKHTPGPWNVFYKSKYDEWHVSVPMSSGSMKWALFDDGIRSENPEADARLIAAAPDLLRALIDLGDWLAYGLNKADGAEPTAEDHAACERVAAQARAAIKKATEATE